VALAVAAAARAVVPQEPEHLLVTMVAAVVVVVLQAIRAMVVMAHKARLSLRIRLKHPATF
jgi:hypothetical protein